jgi:predicted small lipoprotein YifL
MKTLAGLVGLALLAACGVDGEPIPPADKMNGAELLPSLSTDIGVAT